MEKKDTSVAVKKKLPLRKRLLHIVGLPVWVLASFVFAALTVGVIAGGVPVGPLGNTVIAALVYALALVIVVGVPLKLFKIKTTKEELGLARLPNWNDILLAPGGFIAYMILTGLLMAAVSALFPVFDVEQVQDVGFSGLSRNYEYILAFITLVVVAPVAEEVLIRGYLYGKLRNVASVAVALIVSSVLFSAMHMQWNVAINVLPLGVVMVLMREMTGSIWSGVLLHMIKNGVAFYLLFVNPSFINTIGV